MTGKDIAGITLICIILAAWTFGVGYTIAHINGYMHGANQVEQYYEATGEFPGEEWLQDFEGTRFNHSDEILDTLNPYGGN